MAADVPQCEPNDSAPLESPGQQHISKGGRGGRRKRHSTSTIASDGRVVPWLAAEGPLAYRPEQPPDRDYFFQYGWVLPEILADRANRRRHYYFGASSKECASDLFAFWQRARIGYPERVACLMGTLNDDEITAPMAVYQVNEPWRGPGFLMMQHGSYQFVREGDQPIISSGQLTLYRGLERSEEFRFFQPGALDEAQQGAWRLYCRIQSYVLSDSVRSFNSVHDRAKRSETGHIRDGTWVTDEIARQHGLDIDSGGFTGALWRVTHESFALERWVAENKFGPHYVVCQTPLDNVRMTTFFAGEREVRIVDPRKVEVTETHGCRICQV